MIKLFKSIIIILLLASLLFFTACTNIDTIPGINHPPQIESITTDPDFVSRGDKVTLTCIATDPDGDSLTYIWSEIDSETSDNIEEEEDNDEDNDNDEDDQPPDDERHFIPFRNLKNIIGNGAQVTWQASETAGYYKIKCTVRDKKGEEDSKEKSIFVNVGTEEDYVKIFSVTPDSGLIDGVETDFKVVVDYKLYSFDKGDLCVSFNFKEPNIFTSTSDVISGESYIDVNKGAGFHTFNVSIKPRNWGELADFMVLVILDEQPLVSTYWLTSDDKVLTFK